MFDIPWSWILQSSPNGTITFIVQKSNDDWRMANDSWPDCIVFRTCTWLSWETDVVLGDDSAIGARVLIRYTLGESYLREAIDWRNVQCLWTHRRCLHETRCNMWPENRFFLWCKINTYLDCSVAFFSGKMQWSFRARKFHNWMCAAEHFWMTNFMYSRELLWSCVGCWPDILQAYASKQCKFLLQRQNHVGNGPSVSGLVHPKKHRRNRMPYQCVGSMLNISGWTVGSCIRRWRSRTPSTYWLDLFVPVRHRLTSITMIGCAVCTWREGLLPLSFES